MVAAFAYGDSTLLEEYVAGTEVAVSVVDLGDGPQALAGRGDPATLGHLRLRCPLHRRGDEFFVPARIGTEAAQL